LICGGESGQGFRYMDLAWAHTIQSDCERNGVAFFMKQLAGKKPFPPEFTVVRQFPADACAR
jgi:protein gp37